ncbi:flagellin N-terminal helical domain-containing protein [Undibacterium terreum]|uniref:Flagellin n=1 Tax=Undibacterium terreum TaxID=1224302 RepID=A0A916XRR7_9BURK|nr:flagellin [Undibacterium terreum]GGC99871.1 B-type flagellin [Undibacterium terreum]
MASVINTNIASLNAQRNLTTSQSSLNTSIQRLSSGLRINSAKDDAAGLAIADRFTAQINGLSQASRNANDGISLMQTAEGALATTGDNLQRIRELAVQSANGSNTATDRAAIQKEVGQLISEMDRTAQTTQFNGLNLLDGSFGTTSFQVGANAGQTITATTANFRTNSYGNNAFSTDGVAASATAAYAAGTFDIQGLATKTINVSATDTAKTVATSINSVSDTTGVSATAQTDTQVKFVAGQSYSLGLVSDNSTAANVTFTVGANLDASGLATAVSAINDASSKTGVTAKLNSTNDALILTNASGNNIAITNNSTAATATFDNQNLDASGNAQGAVDAAVANGGTTSKSLGYVVMNSDKGFTVGNIAGATDFTANSATLNTVSNIDVSSAKGATDALKVIDSALSAVNGQRATFGALQSRFSSAVTNLQTTSENLSASRSRIQDTDFAAETANLTRGQILQQAGTAMLAQANSLPNGVLALLR